MPPLERLPRTSNLSSPLPEAEFRPREFFRKRSQFEGPSRNASSHPRRMSLSKRLNITGEGMESRHMEPRQLFDENATRLTSYEIHHGCSHETAVKHKVIRELLFAEPSQIPKPKAMVERLAQHGVQASEDFVRNFYRALGWSDPDE